MFVFCLILSRASMPLHHTNRFSYEIKSAADPRLDLHGSLFIMYSVLLAANISSLVFWSFRILHSGGTIWRGSRVETIRGNLPISRLRKPFRGGCPAGQSCIPSRQRRHLRAKHSRRCRSKVQSTGTKGFVRPFR